MARSGARRARRASDAIPRYNGAAHRTRRAAAKTRAKVSVMRTISRRDERLRKANVLPRRTRGPCCSTLSQAFPSTLGRVLAATILVAIGLLALVVGAMFSIQHTLAGSGGTGHLRVSALLAPTPRRSNRPNMRLAIVLLSAPENRARREHVRASWLNPLQDRTRGGASRHGFTSEASRSVAVRGCFVMPSYAR